MTVLLAVAVLAGGCGGGGPSADAGRVVSNGPGVADRATLAGAGSTSAAAVVEEWTRLRHADAPGVAIRYEAVGSGTGIRRVVSRASDFALSEVAMTNDEQRATAAQGVVQLPLFGGAVAIVYNLPGVQNLRFSEGTLARIFSGEVRRWDNAAVKQDNPGKELPPTAIAPVHRSDGSGSTLAFTRYLATAGRDLWSPVGSSVEWSGGTGAVGSAGVLAAVESTAGAVGYVAASLAGAARLQTAELRNAAGAFVGPTLVAVAAALIGATGVAENLTLTVPAEQSSPTAYPVVAITHVLFPVGLPPEKDIAMRHFAAWALGEGQRSLTRLGFAPLPLPLAVRSLEGLQFGGTQARR